MNTLHSIHSRIKSQRLKLGLTQSELARLIAEDELAWQTVQKWEKEADKGGSIPRSGLLKKLADTLQVSIDWLLTGKDATLSMDEKYLFVRPYQRPGVAVDFHTDVGRLHAPQDTFAYRLDFIAKHGLDPHQLSYITMPDDSMEPKVSSGDILLLDMRPQAIENNTVYVFDGAGQLHVRRCFLRVDGMLTLRADNPKHPEELVMPERLNMIGRVCAHAGAGL